MIWFIIIKAAMGFPIAILIHMEFVSLLPNKQSSVNAVPHFIIIKQGRLSSEIIQLTRVAGPWEINPGSA